MPESERFVAANIYDGEKLKPGNIINGVAIIETPTSTVGIWENDRLIVNKYGDYEVERRYS